MGVAESSKESFLKNDFFNKMSLQYCLDFIISRVKLLFRNIARYFVPALPECFAVAKLHTPHSICRHTRVFCLLFGYLPHTDSKMSHFEKTKLYDFGFTSKMLKRDNSGEEAGNADAAPSSANASTF